MRVRALTAALSVAILAAGCGSGGASPKAGGTSSPAAPAATSPSVAALDQPGDRCGFPDRKAHVLWFEATDGTKLDGAIVGSGPSGVVLAHQYPASLCGWWPFASYLASRGFRVLLFDFRCFGESTCPEGDARGHVDSPKHRKSNSRTRKPLEAR